MTRCRRGGRFPACDRPNMVLRHTIGLPYGIIAAGSPTAGPASGVHLFSNKDICCGDISGLGTVSRLVKSYGDGDSLKCFAHLTFFADM